MDHCSGTLASVSSTELREPCAGRKQCQGFHHSHNIPSLAQAVGEPTVTPLPPSSWVQSQHSQRNLSESSCCCSLHPARPQDSTAPLWGQ